MARLPGFEVAGEVVTAGLAQFAHEAGVLCHQPVLKFIQGIQGFQDFSRDFNDVAGRFHLEQIILCGSPKTRL